MRHSAARLKAPRALDDAQQKLAIGDPLAMKRSGFTMSEVAP
jgi:hypothetical protein